MSYVKAKYEHRIQGKENYELIIPMQPEQKTIFDGRKAV